MDIDTGVKDGIEIVKDSRKFIHKCREKVLSLQEP